MIFQSRDWWKVRVDGKLHKFHTEQEAKDFLNGGTEWEVWTPPDLPLPEVREYDSMEEAIAEED